MIFVAAMTIGMRVSRLADLRLRGARIATQDA
jgi:hypothetical protein